MEDDFGIEMARKCGTGMTDLRIATARFLGFGACFAKMVERLPRFWQGCRMEDDFGIELARKCGIGMTDLRTAAARFFGFGACLTKMVN